MSNFYATIHRDTHWVLHQYFDRTSGPSWQSCKSPSTSTSGTWGFTKNIDCTSGPVLAELQVSINFKEWNLGFHSGKDQC